MKSLAFENWNGRINSAIYCYHNFARVRRVLNGNKLVNFREKFKISMLYIFAISPIKIKQSEIRFKLSFDHSRIEPTASGLRNLSLCTMFVSQWFTVNEYKILLESD